MRKTRFNLVSLATCLMLATMFLSACDTGGTASNGTATNTTSTASVAYGKAGSLTGNLEMFSWWTTGGEAAGLKALYTLFNTTYPNVKIINSAVAGAAGQDAHAVLNNRLQNNNPPDAFQVHMGHELLDGPVAANQVENLDDLYAGQGWTTAFPQGVLDIVSSTGSDGVKHYWSVPADIHRANVLWYNKSVFAAAGIQNPPATFDEFFKDADILKAKGIAALALGDKDSFAAPHLMETVLLGTLGADGWKGLWTGATKWDDPKVTDALNTFKKMLGYINTDHASLSWDQANDEVIKGTAAMTIMGDWVDADYKAKNFTGYGWANAPGTKGIYDALSDTFALPKNAPDKANAIEWLKLVGSQQGQDTFNPLKGAIPARIDAGKPAAGQPGYDDYLKSAMSDWTKDTIVPSVVHGAAASPTWLQAYEDAVNAFVTKQDVASTQTQLVQAATAALKK
jgi:glucose/mannose transport system substrate-binding protein